MSFSISIPKELFVWWGLLLLACCPSFTASAQVHYDTTSILSLIKTGQDAEQTSPDSAAHIYKSALKESEDIYFTNGIHAAVHHLYELYTSRGLNDTLMQTLQDALVICNKSNQLAAACPILYNDIGNVYKAQSKYELAMNNYLKAISLLERSPSKSISPAGAYNNLASVLMTFERDSEALHYLSKAEEEAKRTNNYGVLGFAWTNRGVIYMYQKNWEQSKYYLQAAINITSKHNLIPVERFALASMGDMYSAREMPNEAIAYSQQALALKGDINPYYQNLAFRNMGESYFQLHDYTKSKHYLLSALEIAKKYNLVKGVADTHEMLADIYSKEGLYKDAFEHIQVSFALERNIQSENVTQNLNQLEVKYRTSEKDKDIIQKQLMITSQESQIRKKNIWIISISAGAIILAAILALVFSLYKINQHKQNIQQQRIYTLQQQQEIGQLKAMMKGEEKERTRIARELHDGIGGMLTSINMNLSVIKDEQKTHSTGRLDNVMRMLQDTTAEVRKTAHNLMPDILMRHSLKDALFIYCENINVNNKLQIDLQCYGDLDQLNKATELVLYRFTQELIQNVIKHSNASHADVQLMLNGNKLTINVEDNGSGFDVNEKNGGYGLQNLQFRVQALQGYISITSSKGRSTTIYIEFDFEKLKQHIAL